MTILEYKRVIKKPLRSRTLTFFQRDNEIILGLKKKGFGKGYLLGIGGKVEDGEKIEQAAKREIAEEINVTTNPSQLNHVGLLNFYFPHIADESWNQQVHVFLIDTWKGIPQESEEIKPERYTPNRITIQDLTRPTS